MVTEEEVKRYAEQVKERKQKPPGEKCPKCKDTPLYFQLHERKKRTFWLLVGRLVVKVATLLLRWKCSNCGQTFLEYPDWALPYKRYVKETVVEFACEYANDEKATYQSGVTNEEGMGYHHEKSEEEIFEAQDHEKKEQEPVLSPSTLWRWVECVGNAGKSLSAFVVELKKKSVELAKAFEKETDEIDLDPKRSFKSYFRKELLENCLKVRIALKTFTKDKFLEIFPPDPAQEIVDSRL